MPPCHHIHPGSKKEQISASGDKYEFSEEICKMTLRKCNKFVGFW